MDMNDKLIEDWRMFIEQAQKVEKLLTAGSYDDAKVLMAFVTGLARGLAMRAGVLFGEDECNKNI